NDFAEPVHGLRREREGDRKNDVAPVVEDAVVVSELEIVAVDGADDAILAQDLGGLDDLLDEHGALALRRGREEVEVLPHRAADAARDPDVVVEPAQASRNRGLDQVVVDLDPALGTDAAVVEEFDAA